MTEHDRQIRRMDRRYRRMKQSDSREARHKRMKMLFVYVLLAAVAVSVIWLLTKPRTDAVPAGALRVYMLDVGQGDALLVQTDTGNVLIDAGETDQGARVVQMLKAAGVKRLDAVISSHPHADHLGGMPEVLEAFPVGAFYLPSFPESLIPAGYTFSRVLEFAAEKQISVKQPQCRETISLGCAELEFLCVDNSEYDDLNDCSLGCRITCGDVSIFAAGDIESAAESAFLEQDLVQPVTVYKVSHHGSSSSTSEAFLAALQPQYALISCGAMNDYGHPAQKVIRRLRTIGCEIYRTDLDGTVLCETDGKAVQITPDYDFGFSGKITLHKKKRIRVGCAFFMHDRAFRAR